MNPDLFTKEGWSWLIPVGFWSSSRRFRWEKWFWTVVTWLVVIADLYFNKYWLKISIVYLAVVSNYALVLTCAGGEQAAEAKEKVKETNDNTQP